MGKKERGVRGGSEEEWRGEGQRRNGEGRVRGGMERGGSEEEWRGEGQRRNGEGRVRGGMERGGSEERVTVMITHRVHSLNDSHLFLPVKILIHCFLHTSQQVLQ